MKVVLDNGWTVGTEEFLKLFDMLELNKKVIVNEEFKSFIEFCYLLGIMLKIDEAQVESYFSREKPITNNLDALVAVTQLLQN